MAPRPSAQRRSIAQSEAFHDLGVRGRKTGVFLKDTGARDEHGMQPLDDIFSSPEKDSQNGVEEDEEEAEESDEEPMDIDETTGPAPSAFMNGSRFPPARARSPPKTNMQSPARRNPHLGHSSSPIRGSVVRPSDVSSSPRPAKPPQRKLDFKNKPSLAKTNGINGKSKAVATTNGHVSPAEDESEEEPQLDEESMAILDGGDDDAGVDGEGPEDDDDATEPADAEEEEEEEEAPPTPPAAKRKGRPKKAAPVQEPEEASEEAVEEQLEEEPIVQSIEADTEPPHSGKKRGRPPKNKDAEEETTGQPSKKKAKRVSDVAENETGESSQQANGRKRGRPKAVKPTGNDDTSNSKKPAIPKQKRAQKQRISTGIGDTSVAEVPRGPPLPKSRGLIISRREAPGGLTTRSGRTSYQPLQYWKNEHVELDDDEIFDDGKQHFKLSRIKEIVRYDDPEPEHKTGSRRKGGKSAAGRKAKRRDYDSEEDELEPWEENADSIMGEVVVWQPEHELNPPGPDEQIEVAEEQLAVSAGAIITKEIRNATFKFAKTLSTPFFGAGVVDLPPHSEKKPKNSRKMHMAFFVFSGRVQVTVADTTFSIGKGGMWFVPRGNYYSIENGHDQPARIMFSQGCEVLSGAAGEASMVA
ncbi:cupin domain-containing protein [Diaporthe amygdali]|uniref:cupin domain-containing protein n=1 Tax=Phomopsis amygdali TaxID=1214568 RepID=UPI0022FEAF31|nr:cupin domain-containing protein [Diaporthe amygdali]KAJ0125182.1 cupin domain-containing protein [Diaporthe amygdali]